MPARDGDDEADADTYYMPKNFALLTSVLMKHGLVSPAELSAGQPVGPATTVLRAPDADGVRAIVGRGSPYGVYKSFDRSPLPD